MFDEIYNPSPLSFQTSSPPISSPIGNALNSYGNYMELVNLYCSNQPHLYSQCFETNAIEFLSYAQYQLLRKKHEQEYMNKSQQKN